MDSLVLKRQGVREDSGMREDLVAKKRKAQGVCGRDTMLCPNGASVFRDPALSCRYQSCDEAAFAASLAEMDLSPTFHWEGASISSDENFCSRMTDILGDAEDLSTKDCGHYTDEDECQKHYVHVIDGKVGDIEHCDWQAGTCVA